MRFRLPTLLAFVVAIPLAWLILWLVVMLSIQIQRMLEPYIPEF